MPDNRDILEGLFLETAFRICLLAFTLGLFGAGAILAHRGNNTGASLCLGTGIAVLFFVFLARFKRFKGPFGIEGEMWEQQMEHAKELSDRLSELARVLVQPMVRTSMRTGRWDSSLSRQEAHEMAKSLASALRSAGASDEEINEALADYIHYTMFDMAQAAVINVRSVLDPKVSEYRAVIDSFLSPIPADQNADHNEAVQAWRRAEDESIKVMDAFDFKNKDKVPELIEERISQCPLLSARETVALLFSIDETLQDLRYFKATGKIRRPEVWFGENSKN